MSKARPILHSLLLKYPVTGLLVIVLASCASPGLFVTDDSTLLGNAPEESSQVIEAVFAAGSLARADLASSHRVLSAMADDISQTEADRSVVILTGDNFSTPLNSENRDFKASGSLDSAALANLGARTNDVIVVPGEIEWNSGRSSGLLHLLELSDSIDSLSSNAVRSSPTPGFPGPDVTRVGKNVVVVSIDSQWWLHAHEKQWGDSGGYDLAEAGDFLDELVAVLQKNQNKTVVLVTHHPITSNGIYAGHFSPRYHMVPVPVVGTAIAMYRKLFGAPQDMAHHRYRDFRQEINNAISRHENLIVVSAHDTGLQYTRTGPRHTPVHHLNVSSNRNGHVTPDASTVFSSNEPGYFVIERRADDTISLRAQSMSGETYYSAVLYADISEPVEVPDITLQDRVFPASVVTPINEQYDIANNSLVSLFVGKHFRKSWATPVEFEVLDLATEKGGLVPIKIGGRGQSVSLRVQAASGRQYVLRSVDKEAGRVWSPELRNTFANSITQDQISLLHPYAALVAAELAEAVGVYHSNPKLVFVPDDPLLGPFRERMANRIVLFEERPDEDLGDLDSFGNTRNAVGYRTMFRKLDADNDVQVDQLAFARARLLDILISDWDRHQDQWRWAEFEVEDGGTLYRPIPRDRDVAFMSIDGLITRVAQLVSLRTWQDFDYDYGFLRGLTRNGMVQDRRLTSELSVESWVELAHEIVASLPDATIDSAFAVLPDPIHDLDAAKLSDILRHRRDILPDIANQFALTLARDVDVVGSNKHEEFVVERTGSNSTHVMVFKIKKDGARKKLLYERTFFAEQTREIFLWGLGGEDRFSISGEASAAIKITVIGGTGHDLFSNTSRIAGRSKSTRYFDTPNNTIEPGTETKLKLNSSPSINRYNPHSYRLNGIKPVAFFGSNKDDGFFLGGGFTRTIHGFRKSPFKSRHTFVANIAAKTGAFNIKYSGAYRSVVARTDIEPQLGVFTPNNIRNFYGLGNDSQNDSTNASFYQARLSKVEAAVPVKYNFTDHAIASITPLFDYTDVRRDTTRFIAVPQPGLNPNTFDDQWYAGVGAGLSVSAIDNATNPRNGFRWSSDIKSRFGIRNASSSYTTIQSDLRVYFPLSYSPQVTMATRVGVRHIAGSFPFYSSTTLGGADNLRGFRGTRFAGRTAAYYNTELRLELFKFASFLSFGTVGVSAFSDGGRVWTDVESSDSWHRGHGGAIWAYLFDTTLIRVSYARSIEEGAVTLGLGFQY